MSKILKISLLLFFLAFLTISTINTVKASGTHTQTGTEIVGKKDATEDAKANLNNPLGDINSPQKLIGQVISAVLGIVGSIALLMFVWGGLLWMTAAGNENKIEQGKKTLTWSTLGLLIIFSSYAIVSFLIKDVIGAK